MRPAGYETLDRNGTRRRYETMSRGSERRTPTQPYAAHAGETNECVQCHSVNDDTAQYCDQCGTKMMPKSYVSNMAGVEDMTQACGCGKWNSADARFCTGCGTSLAGTSSSSYGGYYRRLSPDVEMRARRLRLIQLSA